ncbi:SGNH/GDSL hydrolase family protein [Paenibacillus sp. FSL R10-2782]|uniref:SGNH/GDSL hydrolase family protein n=1 Tax=Paenibacillus sp. FSL R10-2782 TaxID=2954661 RepID=UPI0031596687
MTHNNKLKTYPLPKAKHVKVHGRTTQALKPLTLFWTGSGIELNMKGSELWIEIEADYQVYEHWISIVINGAPMSRLMVTAGRHWICLLRGMNPDRVKNVRVVKDVQPMSFDSRILLQIHALRIDGELLPVTDKPYKVEFIGDSITSGEGAIGAREETDWVPMLFTALHNYSAITAEALNADYRVLSQSGWGVLTSWDNNPHANIPAYYEQICGMLTGERNEALGALSDHDFTSWQPDVVVVNLGTNDGGAFYSPAWTDPASGKVYKQRLNEDGTFNEEDLQAFENATKNFLVKLRACNPAAHIVWAYGMLGTPMMPAIYRAVDAYKKRTRDRNVSVFQLPNTTEETLGSRSHPGLLAHTKAANELTGYLREILKN